MRHQTSAKDSGTPAPRWTPKIGPPVVTFAAMAALAVAASLVLGSCSSGSKAATTATTTTTTGTTATTGTAATAPTPTAATTTTATTAVATAGSGALCITGNWTTTSYTQKAQGAAISGGAGIRFVITPTTMSIDFTGMQPVTFSQASITGQGIFIGQESAGFAPKPTGASTGSFTLTPVTSNVTFESRTGSQNYGAPIKANTFPSNGVTGTWICSSANAASVTVPTSNGPTTAVLDRDQ